MNRDIVERLRARIEKAHKMVSALCQGEQRWVMSVPAQRDSDPDLVISDGLSTGEEALALIEELEAKIEEMRKALDDLTSVIDHYRMFDDDHTVYMFLGRLRRARALAASRPPSSLQNEKGPPVS